MKSGQIE